MSLTSSGEIKISEINTEFGRSSTTANSSLEDLSDGTVATINTANDSGDRPDGSTPHQMSEFYSYDHDLASTSWSATDNTGLSLVGEAGATGTSTKDAVLTLTGGSGGCSTSVSTTGGPFGTFTLAVSSVGDPGSGGTSNSGTGFISTTTANSNSLISSWNSGARYFRTRWSHAPSNKDGTGAYTLTVTNNSVDQTITGNIQFTALGGLCIYENIPVSLKEGTSNIHKLNIGDMIMSYNWETGQEEEVEILQIEKRLHENLYKVMLSDPNDNTDGEELKELILTSDHPIYKQDGSMVSQNPVLSKSNYDLDATEIQPNDLLKVLNGKYYAQVHRLEGFPKKHWTYTILTKNNNFYADGVLVNSELK